MHADLILVLVGGAGITAIAVMQVRQRVRKAKLLRDEYRRVFPSTKAMWDAHPGETVKRVDVNTDTGEISLPLRRYRNRGEITEDMPRCPYCGGDAYHTYDCPEMIAAHLWAKSFNPVEDEPLAKPPPNMGGIGNPPYQGPNYVTEEDLAEEMRHLIHWYNPAQPYGRPVTQFPVREVPTDLAIQCEPGRVAMDGSIWQSPSSRISGGQVQIPLTEQVKAARFGWTYIGRAETPGYVIVERKL